MPPRHRADFDLLEAEMERNMAMLRQHAACEHRKGAPGAAKRRQRDVARVRRVYSSGAFRV